MSAIGVYVIYSKNSRKENSIKSKVNSNTNKDKTVPKTSQPRAGVSDNDPSDGEAPTPGSLSVGSSGIDSKVPSRTGTEEFMPGQGSFKSTIPDPV